MVIVCVENNSLILSGFVLTKNDSLILLSLQRIQMDVKFLLHCHVNPLTIASHVFDVVSVGALLGLVLS